MSKIYRTQDRIKVKIHDLVFTLAPLSYRKKVEIQEILGKGDLVSGSEAALMAIKHSLKNVSGLKTIDDEDYRLDLDDDGSVSESTLDDLMNLEDNQLLITVCLSLLSGIPKGFIDHSTGKKLKGVELIKDKEPGKK